MKFVWSLTTSPLRLPHIGPTLDSLLDQTAGAIPIYVNLPDKFRRTGESYVVPDALKEKYGALGVEFVSCGEDLGPATKLIPTVFRFADNEDVWIISVDDDIRYLPTTLEVYQRSADVVRPRMAMGLSGFNFMPNGDIKAAYGNTNVDVLEGYGSVAYHRSFFKSSFRTYLSVVLQNDATRLSDDVSISNWLALQDVPRLLIYTPYCSRNLLWNTGCILPLGNKADALHNQPTNNVKRYMEARRVLEGRKLWRLPKVTSAMPIEIAQLRASRTK